MPTNTPISSLDNGDSASVDPGCEQPFVSIVLPTDLDTLVNSFNALSDEAVAARAASEQATATKEAGMEEVVNAMHSILRYAENTVDFDDDQLKLLGWAGRRARTPLDPPGQPRTLEAPRQGEDRVFLD